MPTIQNNTAYTFKDDNENSVLNLVYVPSSTNHEELMIYIKLEPLLTMK